MVYREKTRKVKNKIDVTIEISRKTLILELSLIYDHHQVVEKFFAAEKKIKK